MKSRPHQTISLRVNHVQAAGKIGPLLSWRRLCELPWVFRICFLLIGSCVIVLIIAIIVTPIILMFS